MRKVWNPWSEIDIGNTIEYDMKSYQFKTVIVKCRNLRVKGLKLNRSQKNMLVYLTTMWHKKTKIKKKQSHKRFKFE